MVPLTDMEQGRGKAGCTRRGVKRAFFPPKDVKLKKLNNLVRVDVKKVVGCV